MADSRKELMDLIEGFLVGTLDDRQQQRLREQLSGDAHARRLYLEYIDIHTALQENLQSCDAPLVAELLELPSRPLVVVSSAGGGPAAGRSRTGPIAFGSLWSMAGVFALGVLASLAVSQWLAPARGPVQTAAREMFGRASSLSVESGSAKVALPGVGLLTMEGPTELELLDPMRARLDHGRIRLRVTEETGHGFVVEYPNGKVTDLGTEFGLDVPPPGAGDSTTSLVVFDGAVDLERLDAVDKSKASAQAERLARGEGVTFRTGGKLNRIMSIITGRSGTFRPGSESRSHQPESVILDVRDNLRATDTKKFYEIVPGGLREDAVAYVDRPGHEWNGMTTDGMPKYLVGADYVKTFAEDDALTDMQITVTLARPATLYVFFDEDLDSPDWLRADFRRTRDKIGMDLDQWPGINRPVERGQGAGVSVDHRFEVWRRTVEELGVVTLGGNEIQSNPCPYMIGIAAVALDSHDQGGK